MDFSWTWKENRKNAREEFTYSKNRPRASVVKNTNPITGKHNHDTTYQGELKLPQSWSEQQFY